MRVAFIDLAQYLGRSEGMDSESISVSGSSEQNERNRDFPVLRPLSGFGKACYNKTLDLRNENPQGGSCKRYLVHGGRNMASLDRNHKFRHN
jgi:hypothetical protein